MRHRNLQDTPYQQGKNKNKQFMSNINIYQSVWNKFLPLITLKIKSAIRSGEVQTIEMDKIDFERASDKKNSKFPFDLEMNQGRSQKNKKTSAIALDYARALNENDTAKELLKVGNFKFVLSNKFVMSIAANTVMQANAAAAENKEVLEVPTLDEIPSTMQNPLVEETPVTEEETVEEESTDNVSETPSVEENTSDANETPFVAENTPIL